MRELQQRLDGGERRFLLRSALAPSAAMALTSVYVPMAGSHWASRTFLLRQNDVWFRAKVEEPDPESPIRPMRGNGIHQPIERVPQRPCLGRPIGSLVGVMNTFL